MTTIGHALMNYTPEKSVIIDNSTFKVCGDTFFRDGTFWEHKELVHFMSGVVNGENVVDIGAQAGAFSLFAKFLPNSLFYAFEPCSENFELLTVNLDLNEIDNVLISHCALGNPPTSEERILNKSKSHGGLHTLGHTPLRFTDVYQETVKVRKLDQFNLPTISHIKIDTEGSELHVLQGSVKTIQRDHPRIFLEWNEQNMKQCGYSGEDLYQFLESLDYVAVGPRGENMEFTWLGS